MAHSPKEIRKRWTSLEGAALAEEVFSRIAARRSLDDLKLGQHNGRVDLRGIALPEPHRSGEVAVGRLTYTTLSGLRELRGVAIDGVDCSDATLPSLRIFDTTIANSIFDRARCRDWRLWDVHVSAASFQGTDLRGSVLGALGDSYTNVDLRGADLRGIMSVEADFTDCDFSGAKLAKIDFGSTGFVRCKFAGELREVTFWDHASRTRSSKAEPNRMEDIDFTEAKLVWVDFRRLNLDRILLPTSPDHVIVHSYPCVLERALARLADNDSQWGLGLRGLFGHHLKWCSPKQDVGIFHVEELGDSPNQVLDSIQLLRECEAECAGR